ncbi:flagellin [Pseudovibrio sp. Ad37]|uniref:flagellin N-terminal helical domain-containing protein n=1 Tax=Pseudovibrio sp. Ad37 TaxID=989422 RepID=UPI0007AE9634|nr:flagellin [Pseudovibrio sp. Ad37]KZL14888.1 Flagellin [Pseudovibrio sp. Ad37]
MADITLTAAVRSNLSTLQSTANLISDTQERLSTGKKVNSALDNPNSFFTASSLNSRASDLSNLQDDIGQSVSTLEAADKGISAIDKLLDAAKGKANQALQSKDDDTRAKYAAEFNELRTQIEDIAKDSGYKGKNLLGGDGNDLLVKFNEDGSSKLNISAVDYTDLDSENSSIKLGGIDETIGEVKELDGKQAFKLGITADDILSAAPGTATGSTAVVQIAGPAPATAGTFAKDTLELAEGGSFTIGGDEVIEITDITKLSDITSALQDKIRETAGNQDAEVTLEADGSIKIDKAAANVELKYVKSAAALETGLVDVDILGTGANTDTNAVKLTDLEGFAKGDKISLQKEGATSGTILDIDENTTVQNLIDAFDGVDGLSASFDAGSNSLVVDNTTVGDGGSFFKVGYEGDGNGGDLGVSSKQQIEADEVAREGRGWGSDELIEASLDQVREAQLGLRAQASTFGTNLSVVTNRQDFTADFINTLEVGAGKLTLADSNLEGANLAALNTQNQIATSTLSLATQAGQSVLQLIR